MKNALRGITIVSFIVAIIWVIQVRALEPEPILAFLTGLTTLVLSFAAEKKEEGETLDERNRRVMLNHVENSWIKGVLEKSLHGAALLELGIKEDPTAITYPWTIKKESTNETLPAGKSILEIFEEIGSGRSLLILGAPGAGKTTMLLELTRQLIERAREDATEPIPVIFNLASWHQRQKTKNGSQGKIMKILKDRLTSLILGAEKQTLKDWLAKQLNVIYYVNMKTGAKWVKENKMLLLLDGLDEVKGESREECVEAINHFRKEHGLTSLVICSRIEEYETLQTKLTFEGAITLQPLTPIQVNAFFDRFGKRLAAVKKLLRKDKALQELAETPLMLSIMALAFKDKRSEELPPSSNIADQRKHLFDIYINRMFEHSIRVSNSSLSKQETLHYLGRLARKMIQHSKIVYHIEAMQLFWLENDQQKRLYKWIVGLIFGLIVWLIVGLMFGLMFELIFGLIVGLVYGLIGGLIIGSSGESGGELSSEGGGVEISDDSVQNRHFSLQFVPFRAWLLYELIGGLIGGLIGALIGEPIGGLTSGLILGLIGVLIFSLGYLTKHYALRFIFRKYGLIHKKSAAFLDHVVDLIFLRRVGGSYIFVHRLLMEHFAEMEVESG